MNPRSHRGYRALGGALALLLSPAAWCFTLPPSCAGTHATPDTKTSLTQLREQVEKLEDSDPNQAFALLCASIPRVQRQYGEQSVESARWVADLATPLIAYMDKFDEALPMLQFAQPILERHYGRDGEPLGDIHVAYAWIYMRQGHLPDSQAAWQSALRVRERHPGLRRVELQKVLVGLAQAQLSQRQFDSAEANLNRAHDIAVQNHDTVSEAGAAIENALVNVTLRQERFEQARQHAEETLRIEQQLHSGAAQLVPSYALLGRILERQDQYEQAEQALRHAVELSEDAQGPLQRSHFAAVYQLSLLLDQRDRPTEAREQALRALSIGEATLGASAPRLVPVLQILGDAEYQLGELPEALHRFERAGAIIQADRSSLEQDWLINYYRDLGVLQLSLGDAQQAQQTLNVGLQTAGEDPTFAIERAQLLLGQARASEQLGQSAREPLQQAVTLLRSRLPESHPAIVRVLNQLCELELATPAQTPDCDATAAHLTATPDLEPDLRASILLNQSKLARVRSDLPAARSAAVRAVAAAESAGTPEPLRDTYFQLASLLQQQDAALAVFFGKQAIAQIELERSHFVGEDQHLDAAFLQDKVAVYRGVADWLFEFGRIDEGLSVLGLMKNEELKDFGVRGTEVAGARSLTMTEQENALRQQYAEAVNADQAAGVELSRLANLEQTGHISPDERARLQQLLAGKSALDSQRAARIDELLQQSERASSAPASTQHTIEAPQLARTARGFGPDSAFAVYLLTDEHLRILVSARDAQQEFRIALNGAQLRRDIGRYLEQIGARQDAQTLSEHLYDLIARPVDLFAAQHGVKRLVLWLDGSLRYVPMAALSDGQHYLLDKYVIQMYAPAAPGATPQLHSTSAQALGLGVTQAVGGFPALPGIADELCYVVHGPIVGLHSSSPACASPDSGNGALTGRGYADSAFTQQRFEQLLAGPRDFSVLHIGTHFRLRPGNALRSYLLLGDGSKLTLDQIGSYDFSAIDVVTLSACETGLGGAFTDDGREVEGLSALVQQRGAGHVIASLWQVDDVSTAQLMRRLYSSFSASHGDAALGLQQAQRALRSQSAYSNPYYWAGFAVAGSQP